MNVQDGSLQYLSEHLSCKRYVPDVANGFIYKEYEEGYCYLETDGVKRNYVIMIISGEVDACCNGWKRIIKEGNIFCISQASVGYFKVLKKASVLFWGFSAFVSNCEKIDFGSLCDLKKNINYNLNTLPIRHPLDLFIELMTFYLNKKVSCAHLHESKHQEMTFILRCFYTKEEIASLLYPILNKDHEFKVFVYLNYSKVKFVTELVELSNMSKSVFYVKFKEVFGVSVKHWLNEKRLYKILYKSSDPNYSIDKLILEFDFCSLSHLQAYTKQYFGLTPTELLNKCKCGEMPKILSFDK
jgi:AraC-type DNA-binding domain-containing proteins